MSEQRSGNEEVDAEENRNNDCNYGNVPGGLFLFGDRAPDKLDEVRGSMHKSIGNKSDTDTLGDREGKNHDQYGKE